MNLSLVCDVFFLVILMSCMMSWIIYMLSSATQQQAVAHKIETRKPAIRGNAETSDTQFEIIHGTHFWTVRNIFALEIAQVPEFSSKTFQVKSDHGNHITTIFR